MFFFLKTSNIETVHAHKLSCIFLMLFHMCCQGFPVFDGLLFPSTCFLGFWSDSMIGCRFDPRFFHEIANFSMFLPLLLAASICRHSSFLLEAR